jgi:hypothetical protein
MAGTRDARGRFAARPPEELSPAYRRRLERAAAQGKTRSQARGHAPTPRRAWQTAAVVESTTYRKALEVLNQVRHGASLSGASKELGIAPDTVLRYAGAGFERDSRGRWTAKAVDRLARRMRFLDRHGLTTVEPANSKEAQKLARYWHAVHVYAMTGNDRQLRRFERMRLRTRDKTSLSFVTDRAELRRLGYAGQLSFEDLYQH